MHAPSQLELPISPYTVAGYKFGQRVRSRIMLWARHLGDDILANPGTVVTAIGDGQVVWSEIRPGSEAKHNWGGLVVVKHIHKTTNAPFFSVYGHINHISVSVGNFVQTGKQLGVVAAGLTPENGWWKKPHLHFALYVGPWSDIVLPGYKRFFDDRTRFHWWRDPQAFIATYNKAP